jgi:uncharacterized protein
VDQERILQETEQFVRAFLEKDASGHDWWHIYRVTKNAQRIAEEEGADVFVCTLAALLHDVADEKLNESEEAGLLQVRNWLEEHAVEAEHLEHVMEIISTMSFSKGKVMSTLEGLVVQDADRLDAIGAVGIARAFAYSGSKGQVIHDPGIPIRGEMTKEEYRNGKSSAYNHFYEKLLKLKALMNTEYGKRMAEERHRFMEKFLARFDAEWDGKL